MMDLKNEIANYFEATLAPDRNQLVRLDGYDLFEKEGALKFFSGKSWNDVYEHLDSLKNNEVSSADFRLEEWSVLESQARYYYLRAYLEFLLSTLAGDNPDEQYISDFFHELYQTVYMYQDKAYSDAQKAVLRKIALYTDEIVKGHAEIENWEGEITENVSIFLMELDGT